MTEPRPPGDPGVLPAGTRVGHYSIIDKLGEGGEAVVYRARDLALERDVALKTPRCETAPPKECARLLREARAASRLSHPCIVPIYEVFEDAGRPWFAMSLVEGATLRTLLGQRGALPSEDVARYGEMLADALHAAHAKHILHRDVTPGNIFVTPDGRLLLADFGLAHVPPAPDATTTAMSGSHLVGTIGYMAPEQMMGGEVGPQSDIFAAGIVLYQMATGALPFGGGSFGAVIDATLNREPAPIYGTGHSDPELERIIRKALAKRLDERYASAGDMLIDLRALRRRFESGGRDRGMIPRPGPRWRLAAAIVAAVISVAVAAGWAWRAWRNPELPQAVPRQVTAGAGWEAEARISPDGSDIVYTAEGPDGNVDIWLVDAGGGNAIRLTNDPGSDRSPSWFPDGSAIVFVSNRVGAPGVWKIPRLGGQAPTPVVADAESPAISHDGMQVAFTRPDASGNRRIVVAPLADTTKARTLTTERDGLWDHEGPAWSPDGRTLCYAAQTDLWTVNADGSRPRRLTTDGQADFEPVWTSDGRWVYFTSNRGGTTAIWRVPAGGGAPERVTMGSGPERQPSLSTDGSRLAYSTLALNSNIIVRVEKTGKEYELGGERGEVSPTLAPDGSSLVYVSDQAKTLEDLWIQPLSPDGAPEGRASRLTDQPGAASHPDYSPDGRWLAYYRVLDGQRDIWIMPAAGGAPVRFTDDPAADIHPAWSPDGRRIAFASERGGGSHIWVAGVENGKPNGPAEQLTSGPSDHQAPAWSPDGSLVAFVSTDEHGAREVWVIDSRRRSAARRMTQGAEAHRVAWSRTPGVLLVSGLWRAGTATLRSVDFASGRADPAGPVTLFGHPWGVGEFALSADGRLLAAVRHIARGDIWVMKAVRGHY